MEVEVTLIVISGYEYPPDSKILLTQEGDLFGLPKAILGKLPSRRAAADLLYFYTQLSAKVDGVGFVNLHQKEIIDDINRLTVPYLAIIPGYTLVYNHAVWKSIPELNKLKLYRDDLQIIQKALIR